MQLISTIKGTARFMNDDGLLEDLNLGIVATYHLLSKGQVDELYRYAMTDISDKQVEQIIELTGGR